MSELRDRILQRIAMDVEPIDFDIPEAHYPLRYLVVDVLRMIAKEEKLYIEKTTRRWGTSHEDEAILNFCEYLKSLADEVKP